MTKKKSKAQPEGEILKAEATETVAVENDSELESPDEAALAEIIMLQKELAETQEKANQYLDGWQRSRAEFANYKKRVEREQTETYQRAAGSIIKRYLEVMDDLELALRNAPEAGEGAQWASGVQLINRKLLTILESEGVTPMQAAGAPFDPNMHEAIAMEPNDSVPSGHVSTVLKQGYLLGDKVLRPALVKVAQ
jgi:molecular chaperone GrpE